MPLPCLHWRQRSTCRMGNLLELVEIGLNFNKDQKHGPVVEVNWRHRM